jgi:hypothetical protein
MPDSDLNGGGTTIRFRRVFEGFDLQAACPAMAEAKT